MDEAAEWGYARARRNHDNGSLCVVKGEVEGGMGFLDCELNCGAWAQGAEVIGRDAKVVVFGIIAVADDGKGDACDSGVCERRGGDAVLSDAHRCQHRQEDREW